MIGNKISRYRLIREIGKGGMGVVYQARDEHLERDVALKVLRHGPTDARPGRPEFRREARVLSLINHPSICTVYDFDSVDGTEFLVMELVDGPSLETRLREGPLEEREAVVIGIQIAEALVAAHEAGVVHRDLKGGNVILGPKGRIKLLDFGLALLCPAAAAASMETRSVAGAERVVGTIPYMSPEQVLGKTVDERSDLYSLGVLLFEMTTGKRPFSADTSTALMNEIIHRPAASPGTLGIRLSPRLDALILKLLEKDPAQRPASASEVVSVLRAIAHGPDQTGATVVPAAADTASGVYAGPAIQSIAVLPLENLSRDPEQEYFADGMTEALITNLAQIRSLRVVSRTSAMQYKGVRRPLPEIARELRVEAILEGTVARFGDRVRITAQLIDAAADRHLWAGSYERDLRDVLALQSEVASAVADEIRVQVSPLEKERFHETRRVDPRAYEAYLRGRYYWNRRTEEGIKKGIECFLEAIAKDPAYAAAYAGLARAYDTLGTYSILEPAEAFTKAKDAADRALALDERLSDAHASMGGVQMNHLWDWEGAERSLRRAITLDPTNAEGYLWYNDFLSAMGRHDEALTTVRRGLELDPLSLTMNATLGLSFFYGRRYDEAIAQQRRTIELDPTFAPAVRSLGGALEQKGLYDEAIAAFRKAASLSNDLASASLMAHTFAVSGQTDKARALLEELESEKRYLSPYSVAAVHVALGEHDLAFERLEQAYRTRDRGMVWVKVAPRLDPIRPDPRFSTILRRMKFA